MREENRFLLGHIALEKQEFHFRAVFNKASPAEGFIGSV
jgi:hypothetical protein